MFDEATISQQPTANSQQPTANSQQPTANSQQPTANSQQPTANSQQPTANSQQPTANSQPIVLPLSQAEYYEGIEREKLDPIYDIIAPFSEMKKNERYFLNGIIRALKPKKILEVGVSSGGGSALILNAISDIDGAELYSVDYLETAYRYPDKPSAFLVEEKFPQFMDKWHIFRGGDVSRFIEDIGGDIDLLVLDSAHTHPWETLNFICTLPFMKKPESWTVLHDIDLFVSPRSRHELACRYLFANVVSDEKVTPVPDENDIVFSNIGAFKVSEVTEKYIGNLFESLLIPWDIKISDRDIEDIKRIISGYYPDEQYKFFCGTLDFQQYMFSHSSSLKGTVYGLIKQRANPKFLRFLKKFKYRFKIG